MRVLASLAVCSFRAAAFNSSALNGPSPLLSIALTSLDNRSDSDPLAPLAAVAEVAVVPVVAVVAVVAVDCTHGLRRGPVRVSIAVRDGSIGRAGRSVAGKGLKQTCNDQLRRTPVATARRRQRWSRRRASGGLAGFCLSVMRKSGLRFSLPITRPLKS